MTTIHFEPIGAAAATVDTLWEAWRSADSSVREACSPGDSECAVHVLVATRLDHAALAQVRELMHKRDCAYPRCVLVFQEASAAVLCELMASGLDDALVLDNDTLAALRARATRWSELDAAVASPLVAANLAGRAPAWQATLRALAETALYSDAPLLITGPTGTGKELLARLVHTLDPRPDKAELVVVDCTTLTRELAGSELFGHERGAFTGAVSDRMGAVAAADGGTLFLDEVGELPLEIQASFLRVLQEQAYRRVGATRWQRASFRLVSATHRDLNAEVAAGRFRADLYHRLASNVCHTPALTDRREDIPLLVRHFIDGAVGRRGVKLSPQLVEHLSRRSYPGNVRELQQLLRACLRRYPGVGTMTLGCLPQEEWAREETTLEPVPRQPPPAAEPGPQETHLEECVRQALQQGIGLKDMGRLVEAVAVRIALEEAGSVSAAATQLGVSARALHLRRAAARGAANT